MFSTQTDTDRRAHRQKDRQTNIDRHTPRQADTDRKTVFKISTLWGLARNTIKSKLY